jgi:hypothetical protein
MKGFYILSLSYPIFHSFELRFKIAKPKKNKGSLPSTPVNLNLNQIHYQPDIEFLKQHDFLFGISLIVFNCK